MKKTLGTATPRSGGSSDCRAPSPRAEPGSGRGLGPQTGAEIETQTEVGVVGGVSTGGHCPRVRRRLRSRESASMKLASRASCRSPGSPGARLWCRAELSAGRRS